MSNKPTNYDFIQDQRPLNEITKATASLDLNTQTISNVGTVDGVDISSHAHSGAGQGGTISHASLSNLSADDHSIYSLVAGTRAFSGVVSGVTPTLTAHLTTKGYVDDLVQGLDWQQSVLDRYNPTPGLPPAPVLGARYLSTATANGWTIDHIYEWNSATWTNFTPNKGWALWVEDETAQYNYNGTAWVIFGATIDHGNLIGLGDDDHTQYLNETRHDTTLRHTLGTVVPHDAHGSLSGIGVNDHHNQTHEINGTDHLTTGGALDWSKVNKTGSNLTDIATRAHSSLSSLTADDHTIYALLAGRTGGQSLIGGIAASNILTLESTSHITKGYIILNPTGGNVGVNTATPGFVLDVNGTIGTNNDIEITNAAKGVILKSANFRWRVTIDDSGILSADKVV